jgi:hypothetical protein
VVSYQLSYYRNLVLLNRNIARLRRDVRLQSSEIELLIAADLDCTSVALRLMRAQADLVLYIEKRERLVASVARDN